MVRDFLGVDGRNSSDFFMRKSLGGRLDSAFPVSSVVHQPFQNKASVLQKFMTFEPSGEDKGKKPFIDAFEASNATCAVETPEKISIHSSQNQSADTHRATNCPNPTATSVKQQALGSIVASNPSLVTNRIGSFTPRNASKPHVKNAPLTVFYAGSVTVYDDVPSHMAQAIMLMASRECKAAINAGHTRSEASVLPSLSKGMVADGLNVTTQTLNNTDNHVQNPCSQNKTGSEHRLDDNKMGTKSIGDLIVASKNHSTKMINTWMGAATSASIMPRAVPQARKASLARFLEKRKERVSNMMPYSCEKKSPDSSIVLEGAPLSKKCSSADASSSGCGSWCVSQTKSCSDSDEFPSTELEM